MSQPSTTDRPPVVLAVHLVWEAILLLVVGIVAVLAATVPEVSVFSHGNVWSRLVLLGLPAIALAFSLRTGTPNLAIGAMAGASGAIFAELNVDGWAGPAAGLVAVLLTVLFGLVLALIVGLGAPVWAVSLGGLAVAQAVSLGVNQTKGSTVLLHASGLSPGVFQGLAVPVVLVSLAGGALWALPGPRQALSLGAPARAPGGRATGRLVPALVGFGGSSLLAALAGILNVLYLHASMPQDSASVLLPALGAVLLGGVSAHGRGGGIAGTILAVFLLDLIGLWLLIEGVPSWVATTLIAGLAILVGTVIGALLSLISRALGGPRPAYPGPGGQPEPPNQLA